MTKVALNSEDYEKLRWAKFVDQRGRCRACGKSLSFSEAELHHLSGRGIGGGFRSDTPEETEILCGGPNGCHQKADKNRKSKFQ